MGRKKRTIVALKPFCYYCDKEFNNEIILHQHQKARHFNCRQCRKRFSTAPALDTHMLQVHKEKLVRVPNAKSTRDTFDISIYGMDGVPIELVNLKMAEKVSSKRRKLIRENKLIAEEEDLKEEKKGRRKDKKKDIDIKNIISKGTGFYHNPDSINLTLNANQMNSMYNYGSGMLNNQMSMNYQNQMANEQMYHSQQNMNNFQGMMGNMNASNMQGLNLINFQNGTNPLNSSFPQLHSQNAFQQNMIINPTSPNVNNQSVEMNRNNEAMNIQKEEIERNISVHGEIRSMEESIKIQMNKFKENYTS